MYSVSVPPTTSSILVMSSPTRDEYIKNLIERLMTSAKINERMSKLILDFEQEIERLRSELRNVTRACNSSKTEPTLSGIDNVCKKNCERLKMEYEALNHKMRQQDEVLKDLRIYIDRVEKRASWNMKAIDSLLLYMRKKFKWVNIQN